MQKVLNAFNRYRFLSRKAGNFHPILQLYEVKHKLLPKVTEPAYGRTEHKCTCFFFLFLFLFFLFLFFFFLLLLPTSFLHLMYGEGYFRGEFVSHFNFGRYGVVGEVDRHEIEVWNEATWNYLNCHHFLIGKRANWITQHSEANVDFLGNWDCVYTCVALFLWWVYKINCDFILLVNTAGIKKRTFSLYWDFIIISFISRSLIPLLFYTLC